jgi:hypothetical protein
VRWRGFEDGSLQALCGGEILARWHTATPFPSLDLPANTSDSQADSCGRFWCSTSLWPYAHARSHVIDRTTHAGPVWGRLTYQGRWLGEADRPLAAERTAATVFATPADLRLIDFESTVEAAVGPVIFSTPTEGLLHLRLPANTPTNNVASSEGARTAGELGMAPAGWCYLDSDKLGIAWLVHPANPGGGCHWRFDAPDTLHASPFGGFSGLATLLPDTRLRLAVGESLTLRCRLCLLTGKRSLPDIRQHYANFAYPPVVEIG